MRRELKAKSLFFKEYRGIEQQVARRAHNPKVTGSSPVPATTRVIRNGYSFFCFKLKYTKGLEVYCLSVKQQIFLTFYLKTNKVKNQIYIKLTVKTDKTDSKIDSKSQKNPNNLFNFQSVPLKYIGFLLRGILPETPYNPQVVDI